MMDTFGPADVGKPIRVVLHHLADQFGAVGQQSTGPVTEAGKAKMRNNALRHGLTSKYALIPGEDPEEYASLSQDLLSAWKPTNTQEELLITQIVDAAWRLMRARRIETRTYE